MDYILGFDSGGTKTECVVKTAAGDLITRTVSCPSNSSRIGVGPAVRNLVTAADGALGQARLERGDVRAIGAGLAGTTDPRRRQLMRDGLQEAFPDARIVMMTDLDAALAAAPEGPLIVLVAGTGS